MHMILACAVNTFTTGSGVGCATCPAGTSTNSLTASSGCSSMRAMHPSRPAACIHEDQLIWRRVPCALQTVPLAHPAVADPIASVRARLDPSSRIERIRLLTCLPSDSLARLPCSVRHQHVCLCGVVWIVLCLPDGLREHHRRDHLHVPRRLQHGRCGRLPRLHAYAHAHAHASCGNPAYEDVRGGSHALLHHCPLFCSVHQRHVCLLWLGDLHAYAAPAPRMPGLYPRLTPLLPPLFVDLLAIAGNPECFSGTFSADTAGSCTACPAASTSGSGAATCACNAGYFGAGFGSSLVCTGTGVPERTDMRTRHAEQGRAGAGGRPVCMGPCGALHGLALMGPHAPAPPRARPHAPAPPRPRPRPHARPHARPRARPHAHAHARPHAHALRSRSRLSPFSLRSSLLASRLSSLASRSSLSPSRSRSLALFALALRSLLSPSRSLRLHSSLSLFALSLSPAFACALRSRPRLRALIALVRAPSLAACGANTYSLATATSCTPCPTDSYSGSAASTCICTPGNALSGSGDNLVCTPCLEGTYSPSGAPCIGPLEGLGEGWDGRRA